MIAPNVYELINCASTEYASFAALLNRPPNPVFSPRISQKKRRINARRRQSFSR